MITKIKHHLAHPLMRGIDIDAPEAVNICSRIIRGKKILRGIYEEWYALLKKELKGNNGKSILELGSGGGFIKDFIPASITSEVQKVPVVDVVLNGHSLPFKKESLSGIVMIDVLHHIPDIKSFLKNAVYCVKQGGVIVMIEPWITPLSGIVYRYLHNEPFDPGAENWKFPEGRPLSQANIALPWIVFNRDKGRFERDFPELQIKSIKMLKDCCYILTGGVSFRSLLPDCLLRLCRRIEKKLNRWSSAYAMFAAITLVRKNN
jgi:SAM-dependent methyltransferase